jgi:hypothetical protein
VISVWPVGSAGDVSREGFAGGTNPIANSSKQGVCRGAKTWVTLDEHLINDAFHYRHQCQSMGRFAGFIATAPAALHSPMDTPEVRSGSGPLKVLHPFAFGTRAFDAKVAGFSMVRRTGYTLVRP